MKNYQKELEKIIYKLDYTPKLLLHSCCAPCSSYVIEYLAKYFCITVYYYNPNISPIDEYLKRKREQIRFIKEFNREYNYSIDMIDCDYDNDLYENSIKGLENEPERGSRCSICFRLRLEKTAGIADELKYDYFGTTLTVSPYKNSTLINEIGLDLENKYNINLRKNMASSVGDSGISSVYSEQSNSNITTIPYNGTEQTKSLESNTPYNTVPIGLGIAASGIAGAIGAVIIDDKKTKKKKRKPNKVYSDDGDIELEGEYRDNSLENTSFASETRTPLQDLDIDYADNQRYRASSRDKDNLDKFYDETDDFFYKDDDE